MYDWLNFIHVLAAIAWVGGVILINTYAPAVMMKGDKASRLALSDLALFAGRVFMVSGIIVLVFGTWMVIDQPGIEMSQAWISIGFTAVIVGAILGPVFYTPTGRKLQTAYESGDETAADTLGKRIAIVSNLELVLLLVAVWAMVFKPGL